MPNIKVKGPDGEVLTFEGVERVLMDDADGGPAVPFSYGDAVENIPITLDLAEGDQQVVAEDGMLVKSATIIKPTTLTPDNIRSGVEVAGVVGTLIGDTEEVTVELDFPAGDVAADILPLTTYSGFAHDPGYNAYRIDTAVPYTLTIGETYMVVWDGAAHECICQDGSAMAAGGVILGNAAGWGFSGNGEPFVIATDNSGYAMYGALTDTEDGGEHTVRIYQVTEERTDMEVTPSEGKWLSKVTVKKPEGLTPDNIRLGVEVGGITGTLIGDTEEATVELDLAEGDQVVEPSAHGKVLSRVTVKKPETLIPENIAEGVQIGGVEGTHKGGGLIPSKAINFYDAEGNLVYSYTRAEAAQMAALPPVPEIEGLEGQWSHTLANVQGAVAFLDVAAVYTRNGNNIVIAALLRPRVSTKLSFNFYCTMKYNYAFYVVDSLALPEGTEPITSVTQSSNGKRVFTYTPPVQGSRVIYAIFETNVSKTVGTLGYTNLPFFGAAQSKTRYEQSSLLSVCTMLAPYGYAFYYDYALKYIGCNGTGYNFNKNYSLYYCNSLAVIAGVKVLGNTTRSNYTYYSLYSLRRASVDVSVNYMMNGCSALTDIMTPGASTMYLANATYFRRLIITNTTVPTTLNLPSSNIIEGIYVPEEVLDTWKTTWADYASRIFPLSDYPDY